MICVNKIVTHFPEVTYSNETMAEALEPYRREAEAASKRLPAFDESFFQVLGVERRALFSDPFASGKWWEENSGRFPAAKEAARAYLKLMANFEPLDEHDKVIIITNTPDVSAPNMGYAMLAHLREMVPGFVTPLTVTLSGEGCSGYISGLREANTFLKAFPERRAVVITAELMGTFIWNPQLSADTIQHGSASMHLGLAIQRLLFGDGCSASYITTGGAGHKFSQFHRWDNLIHEDLHLLQQSNIGTNSSPYFPPNGFFHQQPDLLFRRLVDGYLPRVCGVLGSISERPQSFAVHTGSYKILKAVQSAIDLSDDEVNPSAAVLRDHSNMNSTSGATILASIPPRESSFCVFFGVGFSLQTAF